MKPYIYTTYHETGSLAETKCHRRVRRSVRAAMKMAALLSKATGAFVTVCRNDLEVAAFCFGERVPS